MKEAGYRAQVVSRIWISMAKSESELRILINLRRLNLGTSTLENFIGNLRDENKYKRGIGGTLDGQDKNHKKTTIIQKKIKI